MRTPLRTAIPTLASILCLLALGVAATATQRPSPAPGLRPAKPHAPAAPSVAEKVEEPETPGTQVPAVYKLDDGQYEVALGYNNGDPDTGTPPTANWQIVYVNRFTPDPQDYPITIDKLSILFPATDSELRPGLPFEVLVYVGPSDTPDGSGTTLVLRQPILIQPSDTMFQEIALDNPLRVESGDIWVGFTNTYTATHQSDIIYPGALDENSGSLRRSWFFVNNTQHGINFDGGQSLADADYGAVLDDGSRFAGNWLIRASGQSGATVQLSWDAPDPNAGANAPPRFLTAQDISDGGSASAATAPAAPAPESPGNTVTAYKIYRSNTSPVTPSPNNIFAMVPPTQTTARSAAATSGSFFVVTACYSSGAESAPSNEASGGIPGPTLLGPPKITTKQVSAKSNEWQLPVTVLFDNVHFVSPTLVKNKPTFTKIVQKGRLENGQTIKQYLTRGREVLLTFRNSNGATTAVRVTVQ